MNPLLLVAWPAFCALATGGLVYFVMQSRVEVLLARQREELAGARSSLAAQKQALDDSLGQAEELARARALQDFLADIHIEERHYMREHKTLFRKKKSLVHQERIFFRNIALSNWIEQEMPIEEDVDADQMAQTMSIFADQLRLGTGEPPPRRLLR